MLENPVFVIGHPKSGTSLLNALLDSHPQLMVLPEESDFYNVVVPLIHTLNMKRNLSAERKRKMVIDRITQITHIRNFFRGKVDDDISGNFDYTNFDQSEFRKLIENEVDWTNISPKKLLLNIIEAYKRNMSQQADKHEFKYWVEKTPKHTFHTEQILEDFPQAKFIFNYRDPRDNYLSYKKKWTEKLDVYTFCINWNRCFDAFYNKLPPNAKLAIQYENLLHNPEENINKICEFLHISYSEKMLTPTKMGVPWEGNSMFGEKKLGFDTSHLKRYKSKLPEEDCRIIETLCKDNMIAHGYVPDYEPSTKAMLWQVKFIQRKQFIANRKRIVALKRFLAGIKSYVTGK